MSLQGSHIKKLNIEKENLKINKINSYDFEWLNKFKKNRNNRINRQKYHGQFY